MQETLLQDRFILPYLCDTLGYREVKPNTVSNSLIIEEDLAAFVAGTPLNEKNYAALLRKYGGDRKQLLAELIAVIQERSASSRNMALFLNANKSVTLRDVRLHLFYTSDSAINGDDLFRQNIFSVVQELPYAYKVNDQTIFAFRPDLCFFVNGIYLGYSELKSNFMGQSAGKNGRSKVVKDYFDAVRAYQETFERNARLSDAERTQARRDLLKVFERAVHLTATDVGETYVIRNLADSFDEMLMLCREGRFDRQVIEQKVIKDFKPYPLRNPAAEKAAKVKEIFAAHYAKAAIEKEILYYNFIEREVSKVAGVKELKDERGVLIAPRPKQKFGTDKVLDKIDEFLAHEHEDDYFLALLEAQLAGVSPAKRQELIEKRRAYSNNKHVYSLLLQYAAGFGKSNIIGWTALQLKDLRRNGEYVYDKIMIVVDRLQLRSQIDSKMLNMNIDKKMFVEAHNKTTFLEALKSDTRIVIVNLQKFGSVRRMLTADVLEKLAQLRIAFLIDEIHRSHGGDQHEEMVTIFDELQTPFDTDAAYNRKRTKKNVLIGFTATPDDNTLARFGEFSGYAEGEKLWVPFDAYTMQEAIEDGYILNPLANIVPVAAKLLFDLPANRLKGFTEKDFKDIAKQQIYENGERIDAIAAYVADLLVKDVYRQIRGAGKAMLAVSSIAAAIAYKDAVTRHFQALVQQKKYAKYADAPIYIVYSDSQDKQKASKINKMTEQKVLENFALRKNGLIIVVAKLQTGFDEKRLHTLFLDKEVSGISAIQTISRVNRTMKNKVDCKIVDFSYDNVNVQNIKDAFEHFSNVVVSDFDPFGDARVLDLLYAELKKADVYIGVLPALRRALQGRGYSRQPGQFSGTGRPHREIHRGAPQAHGRRQGQSRPVFHDPQPHRVCDCARQEVQRAGLPGLLPQVQHDLQHPAPGRYDQRPHRGLLRQPHRHRRSRDRRAESTRPQRTQAGRRSRTICHRAPDVDPRYHRSAQPARRRDRRPHRSIQGQDGRVLRLRAHRARRPAADRQDQVAPARRRNLRRLRQNLPQVQGVLPQEGGRLFL